MEPDTPNPGIAATLPRARIVHQSPGRARLRVRGHRHDDSYFRHIARGLSLVPGVSSVETNAATGSILIRHTAEIGPLLEHARRSAVLAVTGEATVMRWLSQAADALGGGVDRQLRRASGDQLTLPLFLSFVFFMMALAKIGQGDFRTSTLHLLLSALHAANSHSCGDQGGQLTAAAEEIA